MTSCTNAVSDLFHLGEAATGTSGLRNPELPRLIRKAAAPVHDELGRGGQYRRPPAAAERIPPSPHQSEQILGEILGANSIHGSCGPAPVVTTVTASTAAKTGPIIEPCRRAGHYEFKLVNHLCGGLFRLGLGCT